MFLTLACLLLLAVIAYQNYATPSLRNATISDGLYNTVPSHWFLVVAYSILGSAVIAAFKAVGGIDWWLAIGIHLCLMTTAFTNTFAGWVDRVTNGLHAKIHTWATIAMFLLVGVLEAVNDHGWLTWLSIAGVVVPVVAGGILGLAKTKLLGGPVAEKLAVLGLCSWLIAWSVVHSA